MMIMNSKSLKFQVKRETETNSSPPKWLLKILVLLCLSFIVSIYTATNVHIEINSNYDGDDFVGYLPVQVHVNEQKEQHYDNDVDNMNISVGTMAAGGAGASGDNTNSITNISTNKLSAYPLHDLYSMLIRTTGDNWAIPSWEQELEKEQKEAEVENQNEAIVRWANFTSTTGVTRQMAIHPHFDYISREINHRHRWKDCDILPTLWNENKGRPGKRNIYVEIGANIGSCVMEMLLSTDAPIIAFEPHPKNQLCLKKTIARLEPELQRRVVLFPVALGDQQGTSTIYSAANNMGNSVVGQIVKDYENQQFNQESQFDIQIERLDSILKNDLIDVDIKLMKLDAQGFECKISQGMGDHIPKYIQVIKFEVAQKWTDAQNCTDLLPTFRQWNFDIYKGPYIFTDDRVNATLIDLVAKRSQQ